MAWSRGNSVDFKHIDLYVSKTNEMPLVYVPVHGVHAQKVHAWLGGTSWRVFPFSRKGVGLVSQPHVYKATILREEGPQHVGWTPPN